MAIARVACHWHLVVRVRCTRYRILRRNLAGRVRDLAQMDSARHTKGRVLLLGSPRPLSA